MLARFEFMQRFEGEPRFLHDMPQLPAGAAAQGAWQAAGLKGFAIGGARISPVHANFIVNRGQATASDVNALVLLAQQRVFEQFGVRLELEIERVGVHDA